MKTEEAVKICEALSSPIRLELFRMLVRHAPDGMVHRELARALNLHAPNLTFHLKSLLYTDIVKAEREGRFMRYHANTTVIRKFIQCLTKECCAGEPEKCYTPQLKFIKPFS